MPLFEMPVVEPAKPRILPASPLQSMHVLGLAKFGWLNRLYVSIRNSTLKRSVMPKALASARLSQKAPGPRKLLRPTFPPVAQSGRENGPEEGRGKLQVSVPTVSDGAS